MCNFANVSSCKLGNEVGSETMTKRKTNGRLENTTYASLHFCSLSYYYDSVTYRIPSQRGPYFIRSILPHIFVDIHFMWTSKFLLHFYSNYRKYTKWTIIGILENWIHDNNWRQREVCLIWGGIIGETTSKVWTSDKPNCPINYPQRSVFDIILPEYLI